MGHINVNLTIFGGASAPINMGSLVRLHYRGQGLANEWIQGGPQKTILFVASWNLQARRNQASVASMRTIGAVVPLWCGFLLGCG